MPTYNKLVRDKIPEIIKSTGKSFELSKLGDEEFIEELRKKLFEEISEYQEAQNDKEAIEELADVLEILHSLAEVHGVPFDEVEEIRKDKAIKRGGYQDKIFLVEVED